MELKITKTITRETLENILTTAFEGGSNYWYYLSDDAVDQIRKVVPKSKSLADAMLTAIFDHNVAVPIHDAHHEEEIIGLICNSTFQKRLQLLADSKDYAWALNNELNDNGDADSSDIIFQYITMGEVAFG